MRAAVVALALVALLAAGVTLVPQLLTTIGRRVQDPTPVPGYVGAWVWAAVLGLGVLLWPAPGRDRPRLLLAWAAHVAVALLLALPYEAHYEVLDAYRYYAGGRLVSEGAAITGPGGPNLWSGALTFGQGLPLMNAIVAAHVRLLPVDAYHAVKVSFAFVGLAGTYVAYRAAVWVTRDRGSSLFWLVMLFPSLLFWSSLLGKEPPVLLGLGLYLYGVARGWRTGSWWLPGLAVLAGVALAAAFRPWLAPLMVVPLLALTVNAGGSARRRLAWTGLGVVACGGALLLAATLLGLRSPADVVRFLWHWAQRWPSGGTGQLVVEPFTGVGDLVAFVPRGAFAALFRPLPGDTLDAFGLLAGAESAVLLGLCGAAVAADRGRSLRDPPVQWLAAFVVLWAVGYGFLSYQNLGTAFRFRAQALPALLPLLAVMLSRPPRVAGARPGPDPIDGPGGEGRESVDG